ncbi:MAG: CoA transferase [Pigmentiphaga sp.]
MRIPTVATSLYGLASGRTAVPTTPLTRFASGGSGSLMPTPRPALPGTLISECASGAGIVLTVLGMLLARSRTGDAPIPKVDHAEQAHLVNLEKMFIGRVSNEKAVVTRESHRYPFGGAVRCNDGFVSMLINEKHQWKGFCEAIGKPEWATDVRFATGSDRFRRKDEIEDALLPWCAARTRGEVVGTMRSKQVPIGSVNEISELPADPGLRARGFIRNAQTPYGRGSMLGLPFGADPLWHARSEGHTPCAPLLGEHTSALLSEVGCG